MDLKIGEIIFDLRKKKGITQEELANKIGVSTAAVSKWETGNSYPDITLLSPIARALETNIDGLLSFESSLSDETIEVIYNKCLKSFEMCEFNEAIKIWNNYIKEYPTNLRLKLKLASLSIYSLMFAGSEENAAIIINKSIELLKAAYKSEEREIKESALCMLSSLYMMSERCEEAIEAIESIEVSSINPKLMLSPIYYQMGKIEESKKLDQELLFKSINDIMLTLVSLSKTFRKEEDYETALKLADINRSIGELFDVERFIGLGNYNLYTGIYSDLKDEDNTLFYLEKLVDGYRNIKENNIKDNKLFNLIEFKENNLSDAQIKKGLSIILEEKRYDFIRDTERYKKILMSMENI